MTMRLWDVLNWLMQKRVSNMTYVSRFGSKISLCSRITLASRHQVGTKVIFY